MTLRVPNDYDGQARCPACTHVFPVTPIEISEPEPEKVTKDDEDIEQVVDSVTTQSSSRELKTKGAIGSPPKSTKPLQVQKKKGKPSTVSTALSSISTGDEIRCPSCGQRLKVPYDRRPITAKCPRCETKFMAEKQ
jgi:DNA-directed RNA polymerase subunit RPC12/RpoP